MRAWYVARTKPRLERQTAVLLEELRLETYLPLIASRRARGHAGKLEPLFPGYIFARLDLETPDWVVARSAPGIAYFLLKASAPTPMPDELVEEVRVKVAQRAYSRREPSFRRGDRVVIAAGPFEGLEAVFDATLSPRGRSRVLVALVQQLVPVELDVEELRLAGRLHQV